MPRTKKPTSPLPTGGMNGVMPGEVLTLVEASAFLRLPESAVLQLVKEQGLPARQLGNDWRFLKGAIERWLAAPHGGAGIWAAAGMLRDDPYLDDMLNEVERLRGRPAPGND